MTELETSLGFTAEDKANWLAINAKYYATAEQAWQAKLMMHMNPQRAPSVYVMPSYQSPITGKWIDTPSQRRDDFARNNARPWEGMAAEKAEAARRAQYEESKADAAIERSIEQTLRDMPSEKKMALGVV